MRKDMAFFRKGLGGALIESLDSALVALEVLFARMFIAVLPKPRSGRGIAYQSGYAALYYRAEQVVVGWHKKRLEELDPHYRRLQSEKAYGDAIDAAERKGMSVRDPEYPQLQDFYRYQYPSDNWLEKLLPPKKRS